MTEVTFYKQSIQEPIQESVVFEFLTSLVGITLMIILAGGAIGVMVVIKKKNDFYKSTDKEILRIEKILRRVKSKRNKKQPESESELKQDKN